MYADISLWQPSPTPVDQNFQRGKLWRSTKYLLKNDLKQSEESLDDIFRYSIKVYTIYV